MNEWTVLFIGVLVGGAAAFAMCNIPALSGGRGWGAMPKPRIA